MPRSPDREEVRRRGRGGPVIAGKRHCHVDPFEVVSRRLACIEKSLGAILPRIATINTNLEKLMATNQELLDRLTAIGNREDQISAAVAEVAREQVETTAAVQALRDQLASMPANQAALDAAVAKADEILAKPDSVDALKKIQADLDATQTDPSGPPVTPIMGSGTGADGGPDSRPGLV